VLGVLIPAGGRLGHRASAMGPGMPRLPGIRPVQAGGDRETIEAVKLSLEERPLTDANVPPRRNPDEDPEIAAVEWLLEERPKPAAETPAAPVILPGTGETFDLVDQPPPSRPAPEQPPIRAPAESLRPGGAVSDLDGRTRSRPMLPAASAVDQVWSRMAEWGASLALILFWSMLILALLYVALGMELYESAVAIALGGSFVGLVLFYPILITLERPVRVTPEQAARDFYTALSHHVPHYRRMWLLLSSRGRVAPQFASFDGFKRYWRNRLRELRLGHAGPFSPLVFLVHDFRGDKSVGKTEVNASFTVSVMVRGKRSDGPIRAIPVQTSFSRGPDGMWYLDSGVLPEVRSRASTGAVQIEPKTINRPPRL
jgi:hypothetical protein